MEYKTSMIAEKMGISTKAVMRIVQQLGLEIKKNKSGHYIFSEEDAQNIISSNQSFQETAASTSSPLQAEASISITPEQFYSFKQHMDMLEQRLIQNEERLLEKADNVVQYQLLQHRSEIEEMQQKITKLEDTLQQLKIQQQAVEMTEDIVEKPKRKKMIASIFGL